MGSRDIKYKGWINLDHIINKYCPRIDFDSYEDFKANFKINTPDNFNFGFDVVDEWAETEPDKLALVWTNDEGDIKSFTFTDVKKLSNQAANYFKNKGIKKGDVLAVAQVAAIMAAKRTPDIIPMCHQLLLAGVELDFRLDFLQHRVEIEASARTTGQTGVEIEALTAVAVAGLTIYDMCKSVDRGMVVGDVRLIMKSGGKSGLYVRDGEERWQK